MKKILLTKGKFTIVDDEDFNWLKQWKWHYNRSANRVIYPNKKQKIIRMHNLIMDPPLGMVVDHINKNPLDNRKSNLRICTPLENQRNKGSKNKSGYKGISFYDKRVKPWKVTIAGKYLGYFENKEKAAKVYNKAAIKYFGEFADINHL